MDAKRKAELRRKTRNAKNADLTIAELREEWNNRLTELYDAAHIDSIHIQKPEPRVSPYSRL